MHTLPIVRVAENSCPIYYVPGNQVGRWLAQRPSYEQNWVEQNRFQAKPSRSIILPDSAGGIAGVLFIAPEQASLTTYAGLVESLPEQVYHFDVSWSQESQHMAALAWSLGGYQFTRYKPACKTPPSLVVGEAFEKISAIAQAIYLTRDLINTPAEDMGPEHLYEIAERLAEDFGGHVTQTLGEALIERDFPMIYSVGRAGARQPRLIELTWGASDHKKLTLVGKGVCFDTGGLNIKSAVHMQTMKKDMGGAAHVLGLAQLIMHTRLPVNLRVLIPAVENNVAANAYRPGDILRSRKGLTVEVGDTDAEGRLVLADALAYACEEPPSLLIDFATLTGAARIAMGPDVPAMFSNDALTAQALQQISMACSDPLWQMPLWQPYKKMLDSSVADLSNIAASPYGGAITAALFLEHFVAPAVPWIHVDLMAWNTATAPGRPAGGEAMGLRSVYELVKKTMQLEFV